jgi:uncharacterized protein involved in exopolysaccharide biosynthesis
MSPDMQRTGTAAGGHPSSTGDDQISLGELLRILWAARWLILVVTALCIGAAAIATVLVPKKYDATVLLSPVTNQSGSGALGSLTSALSQMGGGLGSLVGLSVAGAGGMRAEEIATLQSVTLTERYIRDNDLLPILFKKKWDAAAKRWKVTDPDELPTLWKGNEYFRKNVRTVGESTKSGLVTMTITWTDPVLAATWANDIVKVTNDYLRDKAIDQSERNIAYLTAEAAKTNVVELRTAIYSDIENEIKKEMGARGAAEYALKVIDPAVPAEKQSSPMKALWIIGGAVAGIVLSVTISLIRGTAARDSAGR